MSETQLLQQANGQRDLAKRATINSIKSKKPRKSEFTVTLDPDEGPVSFLFVALPPDDYDELVTLHPPTDKQKEDDPAANVNGETFPAALLSRVCREPQISEEDWLAAWNGKNWARGERDMLFWEANGLCNRPLDLAPLEHG